MDWLSVLLMAAWIAAIISLFCVAFSAAFPIPAPVLPAQRLQGDVAYLMPMDDFWARQMQTLFRAVLCGRDAPVRLLEVTLWHPCVSRIVELRARFSEGAPYYMRVDIPHGRPMPPERSGGLVLDCAYLYDAMRQEHLFYLERRDGFDQPPRPFHANEAHARGWQLLEENLRPAQLEDLRQRGAFEVVGSVTGKRYRIDRSGAYNVTELDEQGNEICRLCFKPSEPLVVGDIILAQKIALETDEESALCVANRRGLPNGRPIYPVGGGGGGNVYMHLEPRQNINCAIGDGGGPEGAAPGI